MSFLPPFQKSEVSDVFANQTETGESRQESLSNNVFYQMESLTRANRNLEYSLMQERNYTRQLQEYISKITKHFKELQSKYGNINELIGTQEKVGELTKELAKREEELQKYRLVWPEIMMMEKQAKSILTEKETTQNKISSLENQIRILNQELTQEISQHKEAQRKSTALDQENQSLLGRLKNSEFRLAQLEKELETLKATSSQEIYSINQKHSETLSNSVRTQKEQLEKRFAVEIETLTKTYEKQIAELQAQNEKALQLKESLITLLSQSTKQAQEESKTLHAQLRVLEDKLASAQRDALEKTSLLEKTTQERNTVQKTLNVHQIDSRHFEEKLKESKQQTFELLEKNRALESEVKILKNDQQMVRSSISELNETIQKLTLELKSKTHELSLSHEETKKTQSELENSQKIEKTLEAQIVVHLERIRRLKQECEMTSRILMNEAASPEDILILKTKPV